MTSATSPPSPLEGGKGELLSYLAVVQHDLQNDRLGLVNVAFARNTPEMPGTCSEWSWFRAISGFNKAHPSWWHRQLAELLELWRFTPSQKHGFGR
jgi:hypothetical protein